MVQTAAFKQFQQFRRLFICRAIYIGAIYAGIWGAIQPGAIAAPTAESIDPDVPRALPLAQVNPDTLNLDPEVVETSPVLQKWLEEIPDLEADIKHDPSFRTRLRGGYLHTADGDGFTAGVEDIFIGRTGLTLSGDYQLVGNRHSYGTQVRYYLRPLGSYVNVAPIVGYRHIETSLYDAEGAQVGLKLLVALSRSGAADLSISQSWIAPGTSEEVGLLTLSTGYALTRELRLSTDLQWQNSSRRHENRVSVLVEWMP